MTNAPALGDLDARRRARAQARAARREGQNATLPIVFGGETIAVLDAEFPLDVLEPLQHIDLDIALLLQQALTNARAENAAQANLELLIGILAANPNLPRDLIHAVKEIGARLLGEPGYTKFVAARPSPWDVAALISDLLSWYGVSLGESLRSSTSSTPDGRTSNTTSGNTGESTPEASGNVPGSLAS